MKMIKKELNEQQKAILEIINDEEPINEKLKWLISLKKELEDYKKEGNFLTSDMKWTYNYIRPLIRKLKIEKLLTQEMKQVFEPVYGLDEFKPIGIIIKNNLNEEMNKEVKQNEIVEVNNKLEDNVIYAESEDIVKPYLTWIENNYTSEELQTVREQTILDAMNTFTKDLSIDEKAKMKDYSYHITLEGDNNKVFFIVYVKKENEDIFKHAVELKEKIKLIE